MEILSQGDNWFIFHLLSASDLTTAKRANAHFSDDLLSSILNEPIPGQGVFWSSVGGKPYPVCLRALSFEKMYPLRDPDYNQEAVSTYAQELCDIFAGMRQEEAGAHALEANENEFLDSDTDDIASVDVMANIEQKAIQALSSNQEIQRRLNADGVPWRGVQEELKEALPEQLDDRLQFAYNLVPKAMNAIFGPQDVAWESFKNPKTGKTWVRIKK